MLKLKGNKTVTDILTKNKTTKPVLPKRSHKDFEDE